MPGLIPQEWALALIKTIMETLENSLAEYGFRRIIITVIAVVCVLLKLIDMTIVNVALVRNSGRKISLVDAGAH